MSSGTLSTLNVPRTQVKFCQQWADSVLGSNRALRKHKPASLCIVQAQATNSAELCTIASVKIAKLTEHELVDMSCVIRELELAKKGPCRQTRSLPIQRGVCMYVNCPRAQKGYKGPLPNRSHFFCQSCCDGKGGYYHVRCFFAVHRCVIEKR